MADSLKGRMLGRIMRTAQIAILGLVVLGMAACGDPRRANVNVHWTFTGQNCQQAGVDVIQIDVAGESLTPNQYSCVNPSNPSDLRGGATLDSFLFGTYQLTVTGFDANQNAIFQASQTFTVQGDTDVNIDLQRLASTFATADVSWDALTSNGGFAPGANGAMTCGQAQVDTVRIVVDNEPVGDVACDTNQVEGAIVSPLTAGNHSFVISGFRNVSGTLTLVYQTTNAVSAPFQIGATTPVDVTADSVGSGLGTATLTWDFTGAGQACSGNVTYTLIDPSGTPLGPPAQAPCTQSIQLPANSAAGLWRVTASANSNAIHADVLFGVPNRSAASWSIPFAQ
ncbi:MAG TPA: hypothetical protein VG496_14600 [Myxococcales bacterium]|nr:hypothetical protein [Myxococcales bacterium]